jgi:hypothetical protein
VIKTKQNKTKHRYPNICHDILHIISQTIHFCFIANYILLSQFTFDQHAGHIIDKLSICENEKICNKLHSKRDQERDSYNELLNTEETSLTWRKKESSWSRLKRDAGQRPPQKTEQWLKKSLLSILQKDASWSRLRTDASCARLKKDASCKRLRRDASWARLKKVARLARLMK